MNAQQNSASPTRKRSTTYKTSIGILAVSVPVLVLGGVTVANAAGNSGNNDKVDICHATASSTNPYTVNSIDVSSIDSTGNR